VNNDKVYKKLDFVFLCVLLIFTEIKIKMYFILKIYRMIECNVAYVIVFFSQFFKMLYSNFVNFKEKKERKGSLVPEHRLKFLRVLILLSSCVVGKTSPTRQQS
jgi:hypothetical protein